MKPLTILIVVSLAALNVAADTYTVTNINDSGSGSLRQAILDSNSVWGNTIAFNITSASKKIVVYSELPGANAVIDGRTQPGYSGAPLIEVDCSNIVGTSLTNCMSTYSAIKGLAVNRSPGAAIYLNPGAVAEENYIGIDLTGTVERHNLIGVRNLYTPVLVLNNLISGNSIGIDVEGSVNHYLIFGNKIGTNAAVTGAVPNNTGISVGWNSTPVEVGTAGAGNIIAGNYMGIEFDYRNAAAWVRGNYIGVTPDGNAIPNNVGIHVYQSSNVVIGGPEDGAGNTIAYNTARGISVDGNSLRNRIMRNSMFGNGIAIDLSSYPFDGPTPNDPGDDDAGPNGLQNYPVITSVVSGATTMITGTFDSLPGGTYTLEFFSSPSCSVLGFGEGKTFLADTTVTTDDFGHASFALPLGLAIPTGYVVTATATDFVNDTSELSACRVVEAQAPGPVISSVSPTSGPASGGTTVTITGTTFPATAAVKFGNADAGVTIVNSDTSIQTTTPALTPGTLNDVVVIRPEDNAQGTLLRGFFADFLDVPQSYPFHGFVEKIFRNSITGGCSAGSFCPNDVVLRSQMAIFLLRGMHGGSYLPPPPTGTRFTDVPADAFAAGYIEQLAQEGITGGCTTTEYCPNASVLRSQMAVFLLRAEHGSAYTPPAPSGVFDDVPVDHPFAGWIEQLFAEGITTGCGPNRYCPNDGVTRGQMSVFLSRTFGF